VDPEVCPAGVGTALSLPPSGVAMPRHRTSTFTDDEHVVSVVTSSERFVGAVSAISTSHVDDRAREAALVLVPLGAVAGLVLAGTVLHLARLQLALPALLRTALRRKEFFLVYQPVVDLQTGEWVGAEALVRWRRPNGELVRPDLFVPVVEDSGLSQRFTAQIAALASQDMATLAVEHPEFYVAINLTAADLHTLATVELFRDLLSDGHRCRMSGGGSD
jgi:sensor c-di-GMP phosphodiesterase-like protein